MTCASQSYFFYWKNLKVPILKKIYFWIFPVAVIERNIADGINGMLWLELKFRQHFNLFILHKKKNFCPTLHICFQNLTRRNSFCFCHSCRSRGQHFCSARFPVLFCFVCFVYFVWLCLFLFLQQLSLRRTTFLFC